MTPPVQPSDRIGERDYAYALRMAHGSKSARAERGESTLAFAPPSPPPTEGERERP